MANWIRTPGGPKGSGFDYSAFRHEHRHDKMQYWYMATPCSHCGLDDPRGLMVHDFIWEHIGGGSDVLCISCMESQLGRKIQSTDITSCFGNWINYECFDNYKPEKSY